MTSIAYVVPFFGRLPGDGFRLWLLSCEMNPTIVWILFTDDHTPYPYPSNVKVFYTTFDDMRHRIQNHFDFPIVLDRGWKLCDYKIAYGEIFAEELSGYDFWGNCDIDLIWGDIRKYITEDILRRYDKIGFVAHSTLYRNTPEVNSRYRTELPGKVTYREAFSSSKGYAFDEVGIEEIYKSLHIPYYREVNFANLTKYEANFHLDLQSQEEQYKNRRQIFTWKSGKVIRWYLDERNDIQKEEFMYIHFWCRPMTYHIRNFSTDRRYVIYSDCVTDCPVPITVSYINRKGRKHPIAFYAKSIWKNRHKLTWKRIVFNFKQAFCHKKGR